MNALKQEEKYEPEKEEIEDMMSFFNSCTPEDLVSSWIKISGEWDFSSLMALHEKLCSSGRIFELIEEVKKKHS